MTESEPKDARHRYSRFPTEAAADRRLRTTDLRVLAAMGSWANSEGRLYPRRSHIAARAGVNRQNLHQAITRLMASGYIKVGRKGYGSTEFWIVYRPEMIPAVAVEPETDVISSDDIAEATAAADVIPPDDIHRGAAEGNVIPTDDKMSSPEITHVIPTDYGLYNGPITPNERPKVERGTRLPQGAMLPNEWREWALRERPDLDPDRTWAVFHDHFVAAPGARGVKLDWFATWRNWVRRESRTGHQRRNGPASLAKVSSEIGAVMAAGGTFEDVFAEVMRQERGR